MSKPSGTKGRKREDDKAYNAKVPTPPAPRVKQPTEQWLRAALGKELVGSTLSVAAHIAENTPRRAGVPKGCIHLDDLDSDEMRAKVLRIVTPSDLKKAQRELENALLPSSRQAAG